MTGGDYAPLRVKELILELSPFTSKRVTSTKLKNIHVCILQQKLALVNTIGLRYLVVKNA